MPVFGKVKVKCLSKFSGVDREISAGIQKVTVATLLIRSTVSAFVCAGIDMCSQE